MHKVLIRPLEIEDASFSWKWRNDPEVWNFTGSRPDREITYEIELEWINKVLKDKTTKRFAILVDETYVGNIQLTDIYEQSAEYHIFIGEKRFWGKGISTLATYEILHYAKEELGLQNVYLSVREDNIHAVKAYIKTSFNKVSVGNGWIKMNCDLALLPPPTVSVFVMVYNHEKYIAECLDGILMQKCNFNYNIVVGEDASTDKSREILLEYCTKYPGKFKLILHEKNVGAMANQTAILSACTGKYIALCEGDDYWTDPLKLQKQVDFLEENEEYNISMGKVTAYHEKNGKMIYKDSVNPYVKKTYTVKDYIKTMFSQTSSFVFRNNLEFPNWFYKVHAGDQSLVVIASKNSKIYYHDDFFSVYRIHDGSVSHKTDPLIAYEKSVFFLNSIDDFTDFKYSKQIKMRKLNNYLFYRMKKANNMVINFFLKTIMFLIRKMISFT